MFPEAPVPRRIGDYAIVRRLRMEGSVEVYLAREEGPMGFAREVMLRAVRRDPTDDGAHAVELAREARICARLNHPAIVRVLGLFEDRERVVLVLENVDGVPLAELLQSLSERGEALDDAAAAYVGASVASAVAHAHAVTDEAGSKTPVLHRAISPSVILVAPDGTVKLTGFGLAKILDRSPESALGLVKGAAGYLSPEQARGEPATERSDTWSVAMLCHRLFSSRTTITEGVLPVVARRPTLLGSIRADLARELAAAVDAGLDEDPTRRSITCAELARWIARVVSLDEGRRALRTALDAVPRKSGGEPAARESRRARSIERRAPSARLGVLRTADETRDYGEGGRSKRDDDTVEILEDDDLAESNSEPAQPIPSADGTMRMAGVAPAKDQTAKAPRAGTYMGLGPAAPQATPPIGTAASSDAAARSSAPPPAALLAPLVREPVEPPVALETPSDGPTAPAVSGPTGDPWETAPIERSTLKKRAVAGGLVAAALVAVIATAAGLARKPGAPAEDATRSATSPDPSASATASVSAASSASAKPATSIVPPKKAPKGFGWLLVHSDLGGQVYVAGRARGAPGTPVTAPCGRYYVNLAKTDARGTWRGWLAGGKYATIPCDGSVGELTF